MKSLALSIALTLALPGVAAATQTPETDAPERVLATELPSRAEVWARMEAALATGSEAADVRLIWTEAIEQAEASKTLTAYGEGRLAADLAVSASEVFRRHFANPDAFREAQYIVSALLETGQYAEAEQLARDLLDVGNAWVAGAGSPVEANQRSWDLLYSLGEFPVMQDAVAERMLWQASLDAGAREDLLQLMIRNALETGNRARALYLVTVEIDILQRAGVEPDWQHVASILAITQAGPRRETAVAWAEANLSRSGALPFWYNDSGTMLANLGDETAAAEFHELSLRAALAAEERPDSDDVAHSAIGLSATGRCDLALPAANLAELLDRVLRIQVRIERGEDLIVIDHVRGRERTASLILRARVNCGRSGTAIDAYFSEPTPDWRQYFPHVIDDVGQAFGEGSNQRAWYRAYAEFLVRDHLSGTNAHRDDFRPDGLAFQSLVLRQAGYFQLADDFLLAAWNASFEDDVWPSDLAAIYAALPED